MPLRLGDLLVQRGVLTSAQRDEILGFQRLHGRPFGLLAEEMFGVSPHSVEAAWAEQFAAMSTRISRAELRPAADVMDLIDRRQAWQFALMPLWFEYEELVIATSPEHLARAMRFAGWRIPHTCRVSICEEEDLRDALAEHFPIAGMERALEEAFGCGMRPA